MTTKKLDIVLRTCDHTSVHGHRGERVIVSDKPTLVKKCFVSLCNSIENTKDADIRLWIYDDHSSDDTKNFIKKIATQKNINFNLIELEEKGFNNSAVKQFDACKEHGREWSYSVEDDYLHFPNAISEFLLMGERFKNMTGLPIGIRPDDDPLSYSHNTSFYKKPSIIIIGNDRHWRSTQHTTNTVFLSSSVFSEYSDIFAILGKYYGKLSVYENDTINKLWNDGVSTLGPVPLFCPIPSLAMHITYGSEPLFIDYKGLWESIDIDL